MERALLWFYCIRELMCKHKFERGNAKSGYQDESMQDNECCDNGEPAKMSSRDDSFSENIQVDLLDDPEIWKAKGLKIDSDHRAHLIWAYLRPEINEINLQCRTSSKMPVEVHDLKPMFF
eukprot:scaffold50946_cov66-Attheya_sp.AAC.3